MAPLGERHAGQGLVHRDAAVVAVVRGPSTLPTVPGLVEQIAADVAVEGVPSALTAARDAADVLLRDRGLRRTTPALTAESLLRGAAASAQLDGSQTSLDDLRTGRAVDGRAMAAARLNANLLALVPVVTRSPLQALARMHGLAAAGTVESEFLGRPRSDACAADLKRLAAALTTPQALPAIAVSAVAHAEVATRRPFAACNALVARALERLLLVARGVDPTSVLVPEAGHLALVDDYRATLQGYASGTPVGRQQWLRHCARSLAAGVDASPLR